MLANVVNFVDRAAISLVVVLGAIPMLAIAAAQI